MDNPSKRPSSEAPRPSLEGKDAREKEKTKRRPEDDEDLSVLPFIDKTLLLRPTYGQSLSALLNHPKMPAESFSEMTARPASGAPAFTMKSFAPYLTKIEKVQIYRGSVSELSQPYEWFLKQDDDSEVVAKDISAGLREVPEIFFSKRFNLEEPQTFIDFVTGVSGTAHQEKYAHYLDVVEVEFSNQVAQRSAGILQILATFRELHKDVRRACRQLTEKREDLQVNEAASLKQALHIYRLERKRRHLLSVIHKLELVRAVKQAQPNIQILLNNSDFCGALDVIAHTQGLIEGPLAGLHCFKHASTQLKELVNMIEKMLLHEFVQYAAGAVLVHSQLRDITCLLGDAKRLMLANGEKMDWSVPLTPVMVALLRLQRLHVGLQSYRERMARLLKEIESEIFTLPAFLATTKPPAALTPTGSASNLSAPIPTSVSSVSSSTSSAPAAASPHATVSALLAQSNKSDKSQPAPAMAMKDIPPDTFGPLLIRYFGKLLKKLRRAARLSTLLEALVKAAAASAAAKQAETKSAPPAASVVSIATSKGESSLSARLRAELSESYGTQVQQDCAFTLHSLADLAHMNCAHILQQRIDIHKRLLLTDFVAMYNHCQSFISETEKLVTGTLHGLKGTVTSQAKAHLDEFHRRRLTSLSLLMDNENWAQAEVASEFQLIVDSYAAGRAPPTDGASTTSNSKANCKVLVVDEMLVTLATVTCVVGVAHPVVNVLLMLLKHSTEYLQCFDLLPPYTIDILQRMVEFFQAFTNRAKQLILGAGAMQTASLKSISAKHLCITARCLDVVLAVIPHLRRVLEPLFPGPKAALLNDLERLKQDYREHRHELHFKLVLIMKERVEETCKALKLVNWNEPTVGPNKAVGTLATDILTLHRVVAAVLTVDQTKQVFDDIFRIVNKLIPDLFVNIDITLPAGKKKVLSDFIFFGDTLRTASSQALNPGTPTLDFIRHRYNLKE